MLSTHRDYLVFALLSRRPPIGLTPCLPALCVLATVDRAVRLSHHVSLDSGHRYGFPFMSVGFCRLLSASDSLLTADRSAPHVRRTTAVAAAGQLTCGFADLTRYLNGLPQVPSLPPHRGAPAHSSTRRFHPTLRRFPCPRPHRHWTLLPKFRVSRPLMPFNNTGSAPMSRLAGPSVWRA